MTNDLLPAGILAEVAKAIPPQFHEHVIIVGSLAAGYHFFKNNPKQGMRTKDVDCMITPNAKAVVVAQEVAKRLLEARWSTRKSGPWSEPGRPDQPVEELPLVRFNPPSTDEWFIELLGAPENKTGMPEGRTFCRLTTDHGDFALCNFGYLGLVEYEPITTEFGIRIARPEMMALANLLHHPEIRPDIMSGSEYGQPIKRSNKDLGRVLALAYLTDVDELDAWPGFWKQALLEKYPGIAKELVLSVGNGLREMLANNDNMSQALITCQRGLLSSTNITNDMLQATCRRLIEGVIEPLEAIFSKKGF